MELLILDENLEPIHILDSFTSLIWTDRYFENGDFEIYTSFNPSDLSFLKEDNYLSLSGSEHTMIIEELEIESDPEIGPTLLVKGRSLESILDRRIIWGQTIVDGNLQTEIERLLNENFISPTDTDRQVDNFVFESSTDPLITALTFKNQYIGQSLYDIIQSICAEKNIGFKIILSENNEFVFSLYSGEDHSYDQEVNPYVVFSEEFENLINTNSVYKQSKTKYKTIVLIAGEGDGADKILSAATVSEGGGTGLNRREMFLDASGISMTTDGDPLTEEEYQYQLSQKGAEALQENTFTRSFDGQIESTNMYLYGVDFYMGDIVQMVTEYGLEGKVQVMEIIQTQNETGISIYPTFRNIS